MEEYKKLEVPIVDGDIQIGTVKATYDGTSDGVITLDSTFTKDLPNEGLDIEVVIYLQDRNKINEIPITIIQEGKREIFGVYNNEDDSILDFILADGGTFNVLKQ